ncbi:hypothetical protein DZS_39220 [Dickeya ananatis]
MMPVNRWPTEDKGESRCTLEENKNIAIPAINVRLRAQPMISALKIEIDYIFITYRYLR